MGLANCDCDCDHLAEARIFEQGLQDQFRRLGNCDCPAHPMIDEPTNQMNYSPNPHAYES